MVILNRSQISDVGEAVEDRGDILISLRQVQSTQIQHVFSVRLGFSLHTSNAFLGCRMCVLYLRSSNEDDTSRLGFS